MINYAHNELWIMAVDFMIYHQVMNAPLSLTEGPLWRVRMVPLQEYAPGPHGLPAGGQHRCVLVLAVNHTLADSLTNHVILRDAVTLINASMSGRCVESPVRPVMPPLTDQLEPNDWWSAFKYIVYKSSRSCWKGYRGFNVTAYFNGLLPQPETRVAETRVLYDALSEDETRRLVQLCRRRGVTVHSFVNAGARVALFLVAQHRSNGTPLRSAPTSVCNAINLRRYMEPQHKELLGNHVCMDELELDVTQEHAASVEGLWSLAQVLHQDLQRSLNHDFRAIKHIRSMPVFSVFTWANLQLTKRGKKNLLDCHIVTTNMGNLEKLLPDSYDGPVSLYDVLRSVNAQFYGQMILLTYHTFAQRFMISLDYYTTKMTDECAREFQKHLMKNIRSILHESVTIK